MQILRYPAGGYLLRKEIQQVLGDLCRFRCRSSCLSSVVRSVRFDNGYDFVRIDGNTWLADSITRVSDELEPNYTV